jgi:LysR family glycine cleavage system transcriptional activator
MTRHLPPLNWFRVFEAAARHQKFTAAADELGMTQSAVSQQIRALEERLATQLFLRQPRGLLLTDAGRKLLPKVGSSIENLKDATDMFDIGPSTGNLTVAASVSIAQWVIAPHLAEFSKSNPHLKTRILGTIWADDFKASIADVEVRFGAASNVGHNAKRLMPDALIAVCAPKTDPWDMLPLIEAVGTTEGWKDWRGQSGTALSTEPTIFVDSYGVALSMAVNGVGIALVSSLLAKPLIAEGRLVQIDPTEISSSEGYFLAVRQENTHACDFADWLIGKLGIST